METDRQHYLHIKSDHPKVLKDLSASHYKPSESSEYVQIKYI